MEVRTSIWAVIVNYMWVIFMNILIVILNAFRNLPGGNQIFEKVVIVVWDSYIPNFIRGFSTRKIREFPCRTVRNTRHYMGISYLRNRSTCRVNNGTSNALTTTSFVDKNNFQICPFLVGIPENCVDWFCDAGKAMVVWILAPDQTLSAGDDIKRRRLRAVPPCREEYLRKSATGVNLNTGKDVPLVVCVLGLYVKGLDFRREDIESEDDECAQHSEEICQDLHRHFSLYRLRVIAIAASIFAPLIVLSKPITIYSIPVELSCILTRIG